MLAFCLIQGQHIRLRHLFFSKSLRTYQNKINHGFITTLPSREIMISTHWLRAVPMRIVDRELYVDLVVLDMHDYDIIIGMDFLWKYNASIECKKHRVTFNPRRRGTICVHR